MSIYVLYIFTYGSVGVVNDLFAQVGRRGGGLIHIYRYTQTHTHIYIYIYIYIHIYTYTYITYICTGLIVTAALGS